MRTTMNFTLLSAILCIISWISVSRCEFHVVEVQTGEEVTLLCTNYASSPSYISWFRFENGANISHISSMLSHDSNASYFDGFQEEKFNMTSNVSNVFLQIKQVDLSDSGLYICGYNVGTDSSKSPAVYSATYLKVKGWISVSRCEFHVVEVQTGEEVTLLCTNYASSPSYISWFRFENGANISPISSMLSHDSNASYFDGFQEEKFNMTSNVSNVFLQIKQVDLSDSGLYICGYNMGPDSSKSPAVYSATYLKVKEKSDEQADLTMEILMGGLIIVLIIIIIALVLKIWKLHKAHKEAQDPQDSENVGSDDLNYAGLSFLPRAEGSRRPAREREPDPNVVYASTMHSRNPRN